MSSSFSEGIVKSLMVRERVERCQREEVYKKFAKGKDHSKGLSLARAVAALGRIERAAHVFDRKVFFLFF